MKSSIVDWLTSVVSSDVLELLARRLQEVAMPAAATHRTSPRSTGHPRHARPWRLVVLSALAALVVVLLGPSAALAHPPGTTQRVSVSSTGTAGDDFSVRAAVSADGRFVAFWSFASNLVPGDTNGTTDVFVHDRQAATTERVSVNSNEEQANNSSSEAAITPDGRLVAFASSATNLIPGDVDDAALDVFLRDRQAGTTEGISTTQPSSGQVLHSTSPSLSADGRLVAFDSWESNLVPGDTNGRFDVFVFDRQAQTTERVSLSSAGVEGNNDSIDPSISADGRLVAFTSDADNLVAGDGNFDLDVFVHDRQAQTTVRASVRSDGTETGFELGSLNAALSADGQVVAFESEGALVPEDSGFPVDVFVHDEQP
jgi:Tol biopolymer transport system component